MGKIKVLKDILNNTGEMTLLDLHAYCLREKKNMEFKRYGNDMLVIKFM